MSLTNNTQELLYRFLLKDRFLKIASPSKLASKLMLKLISVITATITITIAITLVSQLDSYAERIQIIAQPDQYVWLNQKLVGKTSLEENGKYIDQLDRGDYTICLSASHETSCPHKQFALKIDRDKSYIVRYQNQTYTQVVEERQEVSLSKRFPGYPLNMRYQPMDVPTTFTLNGEVITGTSLMRLNLKLGEYILTVSQKGQKLTQRIILKDQIYVPEIHFDFIRKTTQVIYNFKPETTCKSYTYDSISSEQIMSLDAIYQIINQRSITDKIISYSSTQMISHQTAGYFQLHRLFQSDFKRCIQKEKETKKNIHGVSFTFQTPEQGIYYATLDIVPLTQPKRSMVKFMYGPADYEVLVYEVLHNVPGAPQGDLVKEIASGAPYMTKCCYQDDDQDCLRNGDVNASHYWPQFTAWFCNGGL